MKEIAEATGISYKTVEKLSAADLKNRNYNNLLKAASEFNKYLENTEDPNEKLLKAMKHELRRMKNIMFKLNLPGQDKYRLVAMFARYEKFLKSCADTLKS